MKKLILCVLILVILLGALPISVLAGEAEEAPKASFNSSFAFDGSEGAEVVKSSSYIGFNLKKVNSTATFSRQKSGVDSTSNSLKLVLENNSSATSINVKIEYTTLGKTEEYNKTLELEAHSGKRVYYIDFDYVNRIDKITLTFARVATGSINIYSFVDTYMPRDDYTELSDSVNVEYNFDLENYIVQIKGSIGHSVYNKYRDASFEIYRTQLGENPLDAEAFPELTPILTSRMSMEFDFEIKVSTVSEAYSQYALVINNGEERVYLSRPTVPGINKALNLSDAKTGFKGIQSEFLSEAIDTNPLVVTVDIDTDRFESADESGYYYNVDSNYYYFNREYCRELDSEIEAYAKSDSKIYIKLDLPSNFGSNSSAEEVIGKLYAYTSFLLQRYSDYASIAGIILGERADKFYIEKTEDIAGYILTYSSAIFAVSEAIKSVDKPIRAVVPISDSYALKGYNSRGYNSQNLLYLLAKTLDSSFSNFEKFNVCLVSDFAPIKSEGSDEKYSLKSPYDYQCYSAYNIKDFEDMLYGISDIHSNIGREYIFSWNMPTYTGNALSLSYNYNFIKLYFDSDAESFIASFELNEANKNNQIFSDIKSTIKYVDTYKFKQTTDAVASFFALGSINEIVENFNENEDFDFRFSETSFVNLPYGIRGEYYIWDFAKERETEGWASINGCDSISVASGDFGKTLIAKMKKHNEVLGEYSSIICSFEDPIPVSYSNYLSYNLAISCETDASAVFEVVLIFGHQNGITEAKQIIKGGSLNRLAINCEDFEKLSYLQINIKPLSNQLAPYNLYIKNIYQSSMKYSSDELLELVEVPGENDIIDNLFADEAISNYEIVGICIVLAVVLIAFGVILKKVDKKK